MHDLVVLDNATVGVVVNVEADALRVLTNQVCGPPAGAATGTAGPPLPPPGQPGRGLVGPPGTALRVELRYGLPAVLATSCPRYRLQKAACASGTLPCLLC